MQSPGELSPREAVDRFLARRRTEDTESSISTYFYRLKLWYAWCEEQGIEQVSELSGWSFEQYETYRASQEIAISSLHNDMDTLKVFVEYLEQIDAVEDGLSEKVHVPHVSKKERSRETKLSTEDAARLLQHYRNSDMLYGNRKHAFLELAWHTGARVGGIRALDMRDYSSEEKTVEFVHRPNTDTPLKNKTDGERIVGLQRTVCDVLDAYVRTHREKQHDDFRRQPLFTTTKGRPAVSTLRSESYLVTQPCVYRRCPHGHDRRQCEFRHQHHASKCPSSRSPHHIRTGSITWHRDCGVPAEVTAERVNASIDVIREFYDKATKREQMENRRRPHLDKLNVGDF
ncbi:tyrosine-type recombinase/integrase [Haloarculaceae archaeon H-GB11]|nr:tyrosine-type recombinase/integrase [Haloarculaceae archaeon H-GB11]